MSTRPLQRISTLHVSVPKTMFLAAGAGRLPRAPQTLTRNAGSRHRLRIRPSCRALCLDQLCGCARQPLGEEPGHFHRHLGELMQELEEGLLADAQRLQFALRSDGRGARRIAQDGDLADEIAVMQDVRSGYRHRWTG